METDLRKRLDVVLEDAAAIIGKINNCHVQSGPSGGEFCSGKGGKGGKGGGGGKIKLGDTHVAILHAAHERGGLNIANNGGRYFKAAHDLRRKGLLSPADNKMFSGSTKWTVTPKGKAQLKHHARPSNLA